MASLCRAISKAGGVNYRCCFALYDAETDQWRIMNGASVALGCCQQEAATRVPGKGCRVVADGMLGK
jgi:hypothetical protein